MTAVQVVPAEPGGDRPVEDAEVVLAKVGVREQVRHPGDLGAEEHQPRQDDGAGTKPPGEVQAQTHNFVMVPASGSHSWSKRILLIGEDSG